jgi:hypothetical protein
MLGELIADGQGKLTSQTILPAEGGMPRFQVTFEFMGTVLGKGAKTIVTYQSTLQSDGSVYGECLDQAVVMSQEGDVATFRAAGAGNFTDANGAIAFRGTIYYKSASPDWARLNGLAVVYEWNVDADGNADFKGWEWK